MNYSIKINLLKLKNTAVTTMTGKTGEPKRVLVIPIDDAGLYLGEKGVYLDATAFEMREQKYGDSHMVKQSLSKEEYQSMTEEQRHDIPIIGGLKPFIQNNQATPPTMNDVAFTDPDLPF